MNDTFTERLQNTSTDGAVRKDSDQMGTVINIETLRDGERLPILPADTQDDIEPLPTVKEHAAEPIKSLDDINRICEFLIAQERWRDYMMFVCGINFGLRVSDLLSLRFCDLINSDCTFKQSFVLLEKKTANTRKHKQNRHITLNDMVRNAVEMYLRHVPGIRLSDYMFQSQSVNGRDSGRPLNRKSVDRILKGIASDLDLNIRMSTHTLRKTFGYQQMVMSGNDPRKLLLLQKIYGHRSSTETMLYIGLTDEEISEAYQELNLGTVEREVVKRMG